MSRWYIIHAYSGFENKVRDSIQSEAARLGLERFVEDIEVPTETITEIKRGKKVQSERKFMPGYVLAKLQLTDDVYHLVKNTPKVTGFLGSDNKPMPITEAEAMRILRQVQEGVSLVGRTGTALTSIVSGVSEISSLVSEIAIGAIEESYPELLPDVAVAVAAPIVLPWSSAR